MSHYAKSIVGGGVLSVPGPTEIPEGYEYFGTERPAPDESVDTASVDLERDRRIDSGFEFSGKAFQSRTTDRENINGAALLAFMAIASGAVAGDLRWSNPDQDFQWIASDNTLVAMDAYTVVEFGKASAASKQALIFKARQIKDMQPIPADYTSDEWWND